MRDALFVSQEMRLSVLNSMASEHCISVLDIWARLIICGNVFVEDVRELIRNK